MPISLKLLALVTCNPTSANEPKAISEIVNHDFQSIAMELIEQIERKENIHTDHEYKRTICNFYTERLAGELVNLLKTKDKAMMRKAYAVSLPFCVLLLKLP